MSNEKSETSAASPLHSGVINSTPRQRILLGLKLIEGYYLGKIPNTKYKTEFVEIVEKLGGRLAHSERSQLLVEYEFLVGQIVNEKVEERERCITKK